MNYDNYITQTYNINLASINSNTITLLNVNGNLVSYAYSSYLYGDLCNIYAQKCAEQNLNCWGYLYSSNYYCYLVMNNNIDFVKLQNNTSTTCDVFANQLGNNGNNLNTPLDDGDTYTLYGGQYADYFGDALPTDSAHGSSYGGNLTQNQVTYFDLTYSWCPSDSYYYDYQVKQFTYNSNSYYFYQQYLCFRKVNSVTLSYGTYVNHTDISYSYYQNGYNDGYKDGYDVGIAIDRNTANAFSYIEQAFNAVGGIMSLEIIPHVTLGLCFSIPLVIVVITTIFKLVKK